MSLAPTHVSPSVGWLVGPSYFWISIAHEHFCTTIVFDDPPPPIFFLADMLLHMVADKVAGMAADMGANMVADKVADMAGDKRNFKKKFIGWHVVAHGGRRGGWYVVAHGGR